MHACIHSFVFFHFSFIYSFTHLLTQACSFFSSSSEGLLNDCIVEWAVSAEIPVLQLNQVIFLIFCCESHAPCRKTSTAVQTPNLWLPNKLLATLASYNKITLHTVTTKLPVTTIRFDIWSFIFVLFAMYDSMLFALMLQIIFIWRSMTS